MGRMSDHHASTAADRADDAEHDAAWLGHEVERLEAQRTVLRETLAEVAEQLPRVVPESAWYAPDGRARGLLAYVRGALDRTRDDAPAAAGGAAEIRRLTEQRDALAEVVEDLVDLMHGGFRFEDIAVQRGIREAREALARTGGDAP